MSINKRPDICIYHGNCADGFGAAWAVWKKFGGDVQFIAGIYGQPPPDVTGKSVLLVDFSYKYDVLAEMSWNASRMVVLDHHKTARDDLARLHQFDVIDEKSLAVAIHDCHTHNMPEIVASFDMTKSGAVLAWEYCHPGEPVPRLLLHIQDRDLWQFKLPLTREIQACVFSHPYEFKTYDWLVSRAKDIISLQMMADEGAAIERKHFKDIEELLKVTARPMVIGGITVPVANLPYTMASDAAGELAKDAPFGACYIDRADARVFSLRSRGDGGADVAEIAAKYGGGGHRNAAGFQMPIGWEGDV